MLRWCHVLMLGAFRDLVYLKKKKKDFKFCFENLWRKFILVDV